MAFMRRQPLFEGLSRADLEQLESLAGVREVRAGEVLIEEGAPGAEMYIVIDGEVEIRRGMGQESEAVLGVRGEGEVIGEMSLLGGGPRSASAVALRDGRLLVIGREALDTLFRCSTAAPLTIVRTVMTRLRNAEALLVNQEKLASLGTMAAGLAHELNNPASAIARAAQQLEAAWRAWRDACQALLTASLDADQVAVLSQLVEEVGRAAPGRDRPSVLETAEREEALQAHLAAQGIPEPWQVAAAFAAVGWDPPSLAQRLEAFGERQVPLVAAYLASAVEVQQLLQEVGAGAAAISQIVGSVKSYAYLDQASVQEIDVRDGLEDTLVMLRHRLKEGVEVICDYGEDLPRVEARGGELNQVWTNLIGNAIDALQGRGTVRVRTRRHGEQVRVSICDDGPGVPVEVRNRIFDPFFTTKTVGSGNGLGLHVVHTIVRAHRGHVEFASEPGSTCFEVYLPSVGG